VKRSERPLFEPRGTPAAGLFLFSFFMSAIPAGCDDDAPRPMPAPQAEPTQRQEATATASAEAPAAPATSAAARAPSLEGTWEGSYEAKKGSVGLPPKVKDKVRSKDDGKTVTGPGTITLTITPGGELQGKAKGALGDATLIGKVEGDIIRASVSPDDPHAEHAMTGVLVGKLEGDVIRANLRVAGPDAVLVRESPVELKRK
jgi:hypothetical protein